MVNLQITYQDKEGHEIFPVSYRNDKKIIRINWFWCGKCKKFLEAPNNNKKTVIIDDS